MSGILNVLVAMDGLIEFSVTIGDEPGVSIVGYQLNATDPDDYGSIAPADTFRGQRICGIVSFGTDPTRSFRIEIVGTLPAGWFSRAVVEDGNGSLVTYLSSDALHQQAAGNTFWTWDQTFTRPWLDADISEVRRVRLVG